MLKIFLDEKQLKPVYMYNNLNLDIIIKIILKDLKDISRVYIIFNNIIGDYYIGSTFTNRFYTRFSNHLLYFRGG
jgi:hypothetical protein